MYRKRLDFIRPVPGPLDWCSEFIRNPDNTTFVFRMIAFKVLERLHQAQWQFSFMCRSRAGGGGGPDPPEKSQNIGVLSNSVPDPLKN